MIDILPFINNHLEHISIASCVIIIILLILILASGGLTGVGYLYASLSIVAAVITIATNVLHKYPNLISRSEPE